MYLKELSAARARARFVRRLSCRDCLQNGSWQVSRGPGGLAHRFPRNKRDRVTSFVHLKRVYSFRVAFMYSFLQGARIRRCIYFLSFSFFFD